MKPEEKDRFRQRTPPGMTEPPTPPGTPAAHPTAHPNKPIYIPLISVTTSSDNEADRTITQSLLTQCLRQDVYHCPRCDFTTPNPEAMVYHLADEINKSMAALNDIYPLDKFNNDSGTNPTPK